MVISRNISHSPCLESSIGIVIRSKLPERKACLFFDQSRGLVSGIVSQPDSARHVQHGGLVSYEVMQQGDRLFVQHVKLRALPAIWAKSDISFLHHVLELCAFFLPPRLIEPDVFAHLLSLYEIRADDQDVSWERLIFLTRFFLLVGWYPSDDIRAINRLISRVPGTMVTIGERKKMHHFLVRWLRRCVALHPLAPSIKTVTFFEVVGYYEV